MNLTDLIESILVDISSGEAKFGVTHWQTAFDDMHTFRTLVDDAVETLVFDSRTESAVCELSSGSGVFVGCRSFETVLQVVSKAYSELHDSDLDSTISAWLKQREFDALSLERLIRRFRGEALLLKPETGKPGPEFSNRRDAQDKYFKVWDYVSKPGNSAKSDVQIATATHVNKDMVGRIRTTTRSPTDDERKHHKK